MHLWALLETIRPAVVVVRTPEGTGAGFFVDPRGILVTNRHVVQDARAVLLELSDKRQVSGRVVRAFQSPDLAFVLAELGQQYPSLPLAEELSVGIEVYAIGHPGIGEFELPYSVTRGIVSAVARRVRGATYLQTDAAINPGNSGGPVLDNNGCVVGMSTMGLADREGLNFAVPAFTIRTVLAGLTARFEQLGNVLYCPICGESNASATTYCSRCGQSFARLPPESAVPQSADPGPQPGSRSLSNCPACESPIAPPAPYCPRCGARALRRLEGEAP